MEWKFCLFLSLLCALGLFIGNSEATVTVQTVGDWSVTAEPMGKSSFMETCFGVSPDVMSIYYSLYWTDDGKLMLVKEHFTLFKATTTIEWQTRVPTGLEGAVFMLRGLSPTCSFSSPMAIVAARSPHYWSLLCNALGCKIARGPLPTPTNDKIERIRPSVFRWPTTLAEIVFVTLKAVYQVQYTTGALVREYHWNSTTFGNFQPTKFLNAMVSEYTDTNHMKVVYQLSVLMNCVQLESPFANATCIVGMGANKDDLDAVTLFTPSAANFYFHNVTSSVSWTEGSYGEGLVAIYARGSAPVSGSLFPFSAGEVWAGPSWRDERHPSSILASHVPGTSGFRLWYVSTNWATHPPRIDLVKGPVHLTGYTPILPHPRGRTQYLNPSTLALAFNPTKAKYDVNVYTMSLSSISKISATPNTSPRFRFMAGNCRPSTCDTECKGDCTGSSSCWGAGRTGTFICCHGPPV